MPQGKDPVRQQPASKPFFTDAVLDTVASLVVVLDREGRIVRFNLACEQTTGYTFAELNGRLLWDVLLIPEERAPVKGVFERLISGQFPNHCQNHWLAKNGDRRFIAWSNTAITDNKGRVEYVVGTGIDITEQRKSEEALRVSEARLNGIISSAMDAIVSVGEDQRIVVFNAAAEKMFKCSAADAIGAPLERFIPERFRHGHRRHVQEFGKTGTTSRSMGKLNVIVGLRSDGTEFPIEATISQIDLAGHKIYSAIVRDVTERVRAEQEHKELQSKVLHQEKLAGIGLLASGLAHEIGNPLASIQAVCDNQLRKSLDPKIAEKFQRIRDQIARIVQIVRQLVNFARRDPDVWKLVSINEQIEAALAIAKLSRQSKMVQVRLELDSSLPQTVCVGDQLAQVFLNLFLNAFDAMKEEGGEMVVQSGLSSAGRIVVSVKDNGGGIAEQHLSSLFVPFFTTKEVGKGTGLGLHVSQGIVKRHGGEITVRSEVNCGSTFAVEIPVQTRPPENPAASDIPPVAENK